jgi:hypothetical protein
MTRILFYFFAMSFLAGCAYNKMDMRCVGPPATYATDIKPILITHCYKCHTASATDPDRNGSVFLDDFEVLQQLAKSPSSINSSMSILEARLRHVESPGMPYKATPLPDSIICKFENWIQQGAPNN